LASGQVSIPNLFLDPPASLVNAVDDAIEDSCRIARKGSDPLSDVFTGRRDECCKLIW
jgi:hypothetical protein